ncbi:MAG: UDP-N-acetylmuramate--L-alanine ligase [Candidatus Paceibacterota bacterium]
MQEINLEQIQKVHFIGIGGIGVSAIARYMLREGREVSGSDASDSELIHALIDEGADISIGHKEEHIEDDVDLVVYTIALQHDNPELAAAREREIPTVSYPEMLGIISEEKYTIAISGTHGKTTTTAMLAKILLDAGQHPTVVVGSLLDPSITEGPQGGRTNFIHGESNLFVVEACEYRRSFLNISPDILVITNIDLDHVDYYDDIEDVQSAFRELAENVPSDGYVICDTDDPRVIPILKNITAQIIDYDDIKDSISLPIPGEHNVWNARAAVSAAQLLEINRAKAIESLEDFRGTWRRAEKICSRNGYTVFDDYAHHPTEIQTSLRGFREMYPDTYICVVFQPHLYSRTKEFLDDFAVSFEDVDEVVILPIYAAREMEDPSISSQDLKEMIAHKGGAVQYIEHFDEVVSYIEEHLPDDSLVITMGAGDVYKIGHELC